MPSINFPYLKEFVYGGMDGCVTTFAVVAGATGADLNPGIIIVLGVANLIADGFSMSVGNYLSVKSELSRMENRAYRENVKPPVRTAGATFASFLLMGFIPLAAYVLTSVHALETRHLFPASCILTALAFFFIGFFRSYVTKTSIIKGIVETLLLGGIAAVLAYFAGDLLETLL